MNYLRDLLLLLLTILVIIASCNDKNNIEYSEKYYNSIISKAVIISDTSIDINSRIDSLKSLFKEREISRASGNCAEVEAIDMMFKEMLNYIQEDELRRRINSYLEFSEYIKDKTDECKQYYRKLGNTSI